MEQANEIFAARLKAARIKEKLSLEALATGLDGVVSKQTLSRYEKGSMFPSSAILIKLARLLKVNVEYFMRPLNHDFSTMEFSFRKKRSIPVKEIDSLKVKITDEIERYLEAESIIGELYPFDGKIDSGIISSSEDMIRNARKTREEWNLGEDPIANIPIMLEEHGIKVIIVDAPDEFDGLSGTVDGKFPVIVLNKNKSTERRRLTALHELAHILFNDSFDKSLSEHQKENLCNEFSSEMLLSGDLLVKILGEKRREISVPELLPIQQNFGISIDAIIVKAHRLEMISESRYRGYFIRKNANPNYKALVEQCLFREIPTNRFQTIVYKALAQGLISTSKAASLLDKPVSEVVEDFNIV